MIRGIGVDLVVIDRFDSWRSFSPERLHKVFSTQELKDSCDAKGDLLAEKLASRFAAKEAFYKALSSVCVSHKLFTKPFSLIKLFPAIEVRYDVWGVPRLAVDWQAVNVIVGLALPLTLSVHLSLSHEKEQAMAFVIIESKE